MKKTYKAAASRLIVFLAVLSMLMSSVASINVGAWELSGYQNGAVVRFKNAYTGTYLNLSRANDANGANVNVFKYDGSPEETWKLRYNAEEDCYLIGSMVSSSGNNRVLDIKRGGKPVKNNCNVQLYSPTDPTSQEWKFSYYGDGKYILTPISCAYVALTASTKKNEYGSYNGTPNGTSPTDPGNVFVSLLPGYTEDGTVSGSAAAVPGNQLWIIEEVSPKRTIADGVYTIKNVGTQKMMDATSKDKVVSWPNNGGSNQKWQVKYHSDGFYTLRPMRYLDKALDISGNPDEQGEQIDIRSVAAGSTGNDRTRWKIIPNATGSGYRISCKAGYYAQAAVVLFGDTTNGASIGQSVYSNIPAQQWIFTPVSIVDPTGLTLSAADTTVCVGSTKTLTATISPSNATNTQVVWSSSNSAVASVSSSGVVTAKKVGKVTITAESLGKPGLKKTCTVTVAYVLSVSDSIFISQLTNPDASFNAPGSKYAFDFEKAYSLLQLFKANSNPPIGKPYVSGSVLEQKGYCAPGAGLGAEALLNPMYSYALNGMTTFDMAVYQSAQWTAQLNTAIGFMYYTSIFNSTNKNISIQHGTFSPNSRLDMIEKNLLESGVTYKTLPGALTAEYVEGGIFRPKTLAHVFLGQVNEKNVTGYHYEGVQAAPFGIEEGSRTSPNRYGVYQIKVQGKKANGGISDCFPASMTPAQIIEEMERAYPNRVYVEKNTWRSYFSNGMEVNFYLDSNDQIISFFPVY